MTYRPHFRTAAFPVWRSAAWAATCALLGGCQLWGGDSGPSVRTVHYQCAEGGAFTATFTGESSARLTVAGEEDRILKRLPAASGIRYGDGTISLLNKGSDALLEERGKLKWRDCKAK
ncbi:MAG: MliC family protein [Burkholderiales bacterium]